jgi:hypothetical protein
MLVTLLEDLFIPTLPERDSAVRINPHPWFPWPGVTNIEPYVDKNNEFITEGVY